MGQDRTVQGAGRDFVTPRRRKSPRTHGVGGFCYCSSATGRIDLTVLDSMYDQLSSPPAPSGRLVMGRKGWGGTPPADDEEARKRIIDAAIRSMERRGPHGTSLSVIAGDLGVTRPTIYRYFATIDELVTSAGEVALGGWTARITDLTSGMNDPVDLVVEAVAYLVERLPEEPLLMMLLETGRSRLTSQQMVTGTAIERSRVLLQHTAVDWAAFGYRGKDFDDLVEYLLRIVQSMVLAPADPPRSAAELRKVLRHWIGPVVTTPPRVATRRKSRRYAARGGAFAFPRKRVGVPPTRRGVPPTRQD
jgi:AcrR family transcriptional regulator